MADEKLDPRDFVMIRKDLMDRWLRTNQELNRSILWLKNERDRLVSENEQLEAGSKELIEAGKKLMKMYEDLEAENQRLTEALVQKMPPSRGGQEVN